MGKLFSKSKHPKQNTQSGFDSLDTAGAHREDKSYARMNRHVSNTYQQQPTGEAIHSEAVVSLAKIQPGLCLAGSKDKTVSLYDYHNHRLEDRWTGHSREITKVYYGLQCQGIFSASRDRTVKLWKRGNASPMREYDGHDLVVSAIHLNKENSLLCTGSRDNTIKLWDVESGNCLRENKTSRNLVTDVKFVPDSHLLVQTGEDKESGRLFDTRTMYVAHTFPRKQYIQMSCDVSADGNYCLTCSNGFGGNGCEATLWDLRELKIVKEFKGHTEAIECCIFLPNQERDLIATSSRDCSVRVWDQNTNDCIARCTISGSGPLTSLIAYEDNSICVSSFNTGIHELNLSVQDGSLLQRSSF
ncbi:WD repeat-containing protein 31-like [Ruditapes philippinarum]|uniref:WD repeat-containing protein 31-like n=1 Tax=Ruditapes philippinarum TaxID=129788 RepID=UPI00295A9456|nr:WD repeat-containing protein 31-like [Ruditapes philippinarum]